MSIPDRLHSAVIREALNTSRYEAGVRAKVIKLLDQLGKDLVSEISDAGLEVARTDWQRARLQKLLSLVQRRTSEVYGEVEALHTSEMQGLVEVAGDRIVTACNKAIGARLLQPVQWTEEQLAAIVSDVLIDGAPSKEWWSRQADDLTQAFSDQMRVGMARGETIQQLRDRILTQDLPGVRAVGKVDLRKVARADRGVIWTARRNAEAIVRTSAISVNAAAHMAAFEANADIIDGLTWTSTLDQRTCVRCASRDGQTWALGEPHEMPALHWGCRCQCIPKTKSWEDLLGNKSLGRELDKIPVGDRASMDGPVSGDTTFEKWFAGQPEEVQKDILGAKKWDVWKRGNLSFQDMMDQTGNELSLSELGAKPIAKEAGVFPAKTNVSDGVIDRHPFIDLKNQLEAKYGQHVYAQATDQELEDLEKLEKEYYSNKETKTVQNIWSPEKAAADQENYNLLHPMSPSRESPDWERYVEKPWAYTTERTTNAPYGGDPSNGGVFYHVVGKGYKPGDDLLSLQALEDSGKKAKWKWEFDKSDYKDAGIISLHDNVGDAISFQEEYGGKILKITIPPGTDLRGLVNREGYPSVRDGIPAEFIEILKTVLKK